MVGSWAGPQKGEAEVSQSEHLACLHVASVSSLVLHIFVCGSVLHLGRSRQG